MMQKRHLLLTHNERMQAIQPSAENHMSMQQRLSCMYGSSSSSSSSSDNRSVSGNENIACEWLSTDKVRHLTQCLLYTDLPSEIAVSTRILVSPSDKQFAAAMQWLDGGDNGSNRQIGIVWNTQPIPSARVPIEEAIEINTDDDSSDVDDDGQQPGPRGDSGTHWVAAHISITAKHKFTSADLFDSIGNPKTWKLPHIKQQLDRFVRRRVPYKVQMNQRNHQQDDTSECGVYAAWFIYQRCSGIAMSEIDETVMEPSEIRKWRLRTA
jgi:hypothetical protein